MLRQTADATARETVSKVPEVTLVFWIIKVAATTLEAGAFYWATITFSQTFGTALGDWTAATDRGGLGLGYELGAIVFLCGILILAALYFWTRTSHVLLFWATFILTRPLGATVGDFLDKPTSQGGLALSRPLASAAIASFIIACILMLPQRAGQHPGSVEARSDA